MRQNQLPPSIKVEGKGTVKVAPDQAIVTIGVVTKGITANEAQQKNAEETNKVISELMAISIPPENIETVSYTINREIDYVDGKKIERGFIVNHQLEITVDDISMIGDVLDSAVQAGANTVHSLRFTLRDERKIYRQALEAAVKDAKKKVYAIASTLGVTVYSIPYLVEERKEGIVRPYDTFQLEAMNKSTKIMTRQVEINATVMMQSLIVVNK